MTVGAADGPPGIDRKHHYRLVDHLGSLDVIAEAESLGNGNNGVVERRGFNAHGERREALATNAFWQTLIDTRIQATPNDARTDRGFTGHEHLDRAGLIHMNG